MTFLYVRIWIHGLVHVQCLVSQNDKIFSFFSSKTVFWKKKNRQHKLWNFPSFAKTRWQIVVDNVWCQKTKNSIFYAVSFFVRLVWSKWCSNNDNFYFFFHKQMICNYFCDNSQLMLFRKLRRWLIWAKKNVLF